VQDLRQFERNLRELQQQIEKEGLCLRPKERLFFEKTVDAIKQKNKETSAKYATELAEYRERIKFLCHAELAIEGLRMFIDDFPCAYVHGSESHDKVVSRFKVGVRLLKEHSQNIAPFLPDVSQQIISECEKFESLLNRI
jgi:ribosomal protein S21